MLADSWKYGQATWLGNSSLFLVVSWTNLARPVVFENSMFLVAVPSSLFWELARTTFCPETAAMVFPAATENPDTSLSFPAFWDASVGKSGGLERAAVFFRVGRKMLIRPLVF